jgi:hypothetical protein
VLEFEGLHSCHAQVYSRNMVKVGLDSVVARYCVTLLFGSRARELDFWSASILVSEENFEAVLLLVMGGDGSDVSEIPVL